MWGGGRVLFWDFFCLFVLLMLLLLFFPVAGEGRSGWTQKPLVTKAAVISFSTGYFMVSCPHISLLIRSPGQIPCMMLYCFSSLNDETLLQHGKCSPGRKFNLQHKNLLSASNLSQIFPLNVSVPQHQAQSQYLLENFTWSLILHLGSLQHMQEYFFLLR